MFDKLTVSVSPKLRPRREIARRSMPLIYVRFASALYFFRAGTFISAGRA